MIQPGGINTVDPCHGDVATLAKRLLTVIYDQVSTLSERFGNKMRRKVNVIYNGVDAFAFCLHIMRKVIEKKKICTGGDLFHAGTDHMNGGTVRNG